MLAIEAVRLEHRLDQRCLRRRGRPDAHDDAVRQATHPADGAMQRAGLAGRAAPLVEHADDPLGTEDLVTHRVPLERAPRDVRGLQKKQEGCIKVVLGEPRLIPAVNRTPRGISIRGMGKLIYNSSNREIEIEDRTLAHLRIAIINKLRRSESFAATWEHGIEHGAAARRSGCTSRSRCSSCSAETARPS